MTLTNLRKDIFQHADNALHGENVEFTYKGVVFHLVPEKKTMSKLDALVGEPTIAPGFTLEQSSAELSQEMQAAWDGKWNDL